MKATECRCLKRKRDDIHTDLTGVSENPTKSEELMKYFSDYISTEWRIDESNVVHPILVIRSVSS